MRVAGAVTNPGVLQLKPGSTLLDALLGAGGFSVKAEDARLNLLRKQSDGSQNVMSADAAGIVSLRDISTNYALQEGDLINVTPVQTQTVFVSGEVNNPGPYQLRQGEGLAELMTRAGGVKDSALLTGIKVERAGTQIKADAYDAVKLGTPLDFELADGDFVVVPENRERILVMEAVAKPGYQAIPERGTLTLLDALAQAQPVQKNHSRRTAARQRRWIGRPQQQTARDSTERSAQRQSGATSCCSHATSFTCPRPKTGAVFSNICRW